MEYVNQIGDAQYPPPYQFPDVTILSFRLEADLNALKALCDRVLNVGDLESRGFEYRPFLPFVDLEVLHYPKMEYGGGDPNVVSTVNTTEQALSLDYTEQDECYVRLFVMKYVPVGGLLAPTGELAVFCPILLVDNTWSAFSGRDVMGFPKLFGKFDPPVKDFLAYLTGEAIDPTTLDSEQIRLIQEALGKNGYAPGPADGIWGQLTAVAFETFKESNGMGANPELDPQTLSALQLDPGKFVVYELPKASVNSLAFANYNENAKATLLPVVTIKKQPGAAQAIPDDPQVPSWPWADIRSLLQRYPQPVSENDVQYVESIMPSVQMKEFRDAENPGRACYQAIVGSCVFVESVDLEKSGLLPPVEVTINDYPSLQLAAALGIQSGKPLNPISQYYYTSSFKFDAVRTLFVNSDAGGYDPGGFWALFWPAWLPRPE